MTTTIDIRELPARLEEALALAASGGEVILTDGAAPRTACPMRRCESARRGTPGRCDPAAPGLRGIVAG